jgi:Na+-translocating ferredoxin:NAD+ oxidoreductase RnfG subunit
VQTGLRQPRDDRRLKLDVKVVINTPVNGRRTICTGILALITTTAATGSAEAAVFWDKSGLLKSFFAQSQVVSFHRIALSASQQKAVEKRLGYAPQADWVLYYGLTGDRLDGFALVDHELGQHEPITFGTLVGTDGALQRLEVMVYREAYGDEVKDQRFRKQFVGKTAQDPVKHGADIVAVAGATISSNAMAHGAKRALVVIDEAVLKSGLARTLAAARNGQKVAGAATAPARTN